MRALRIVFALAGLGIFVPFLYRFVFSLAEQSGSFRLHHEVFPTYLFEMALFLAGAFCLVIASDPEGPRTGFQRSLPLLPLSAMAFVTALIGKNAEFLSLYDPRDFPVHPRQEIMFPEFGWVAPWQALAAAALLAFSLFCMAAAYRHGKE